MWILLLIVLWQGVPVDTMDYRAGSNRPMRFFSQESCEKTSEQIAVSVWDDLKKVPDPEVSFIVKCLQVTP